MPYFAFELILRTRPENPMHGKILGGLTETWVKADSFEEARKKVHNRYDESDSEWQLDKILTEIQSTLAKHPWHNQGNEAFSLVRESGLTDAYETLIKTGFSSEVFPFTTE